MIREHAREVWGSEATTLVDVDGDELFIYDAGDQTAVGIVTGVDAGIAVLLSDGGAMRLIAELSRRLAQRSERLEAKTLEAPAERPIAEMSREEIRSELAALWSAEGCSEHIINKSLEQVERGGPDLLGDAHTERERALAEVLFERTLDGRS